MTFREIATYATQIYIWALWVVASICIMLINVLMEGPFTMQ